MAKNNLSKEELAEIRNELTKQAELQKRISESAGDYLKLIKDIKNLHKDISLTERALAEQQAKVVKAEKSLVGLKGKELEEAEKILNIEREKAKILGKEIETMRKYTAELTKAAKEAGKLQKSMAIFKDVKQDLTSIYSLVNKGYSKLESTAKLFTFDKSLRTSALQMGVLSKQSDSFRNTIQAAANSTIDFGVGIEELAKLQANYSEELGRSVMLTTDGLKAMGEMAAASNLGADGAAKLAADMDNIGMSAERTRDFVEQTMNDAHKMGLNASKVMKNIAGNMKMLNKYNFKGGVKGLAKMAETAAKLGVDMNMVSGMAEKLFDVEGAVDMSAQLQVMGGEWAKLADPFKLMYMARNDMEGLMESMGKAAESAVHLNKKTGELEISALEMHKLRKVAEQTGVSYEELAQAGKNAYKMTRIKNQMKFSVPKDVQEFIANTAQLNEKGEATLNINGSPKLLKNIDKATIEAQMKEEASLKQRAKDSQTFDENLGNLVKQFKQLLLPLVTELSKNLKPVVEKFANALRDPQVIGAITDAAKTFGKVVSVVGKFVANNPMTAIAALGLFEAGKWLLNGVALGQGFNSVASAGGGGVMDAVSGGRKGGSFGRGLKGLKVGAKMVGSGRVMGGLGTMTKGLGKASGPLAIAAVGIDAVTNALDDNLSITDKFLKTLDQHKGMAAGAAIGSVIPVIGTAVGAGIGGIIDMFAPELGSYGDKKNVGFNDGYFNSPIHDGVLGSDFNKGRGVIQGGKITPIDNKDDLLAMKPRGTIDNMISKDTNKTMKIEFGDIKFNGEIKLTTNEGKSVSIDILKDPQFIRNITRMVHVETDKAVNFGKVKP